MAYRLQVATLANDETMRSKLNLLFPCGVQSNNQKAHRFSGGDISEYVASGNQGGMIQICQYYFISCIREVLATGQMTMGEGVRLNSFQPRPFPRKLSILPPPLRRPKTVASVEVADDQ